MGYWAVSHNWRVFQRPPSFETGAMKNNFERQFIKMFMPETSGFQVHGQNLLFKHDGRWHIGEEVCSFQFQNYFRCSAIFRWGTRADHGCTPTLDPKDSLPNGSTGFRNINVGSRTTQPPWGESSQEKKTVRADVEARVTVTTGTENVSATAALENASINRNKD